MASKRKSATPLLTPEMTLPQINRLPVAALKLQLDYYHLAHGGNKQAIARRLHQHLQTLQADSENSSSSKYEDSGTEKEAGTASSHEVSANNATAEEDTGCDTAEEVATGSMPTLFTSAQRAALKRTVRSLMRDKDAHTSANRTLSPPSDAQHHSRASRRHKTTGTRRHVHKRGRRSSGHPSRRSHSPASSSKRRRRRSPSTSSTSSSSSRSPSTPSHSSSVSDSSPHRRKKRHSRSHRREPRCHHRTKDVDLPAVPRKLRRIIRRGEFVVLADLLSEHLTLSGCSSRNSGGRKFASTKPITGLDTWLVAWSVYASVLVSYKPELAPDLFRYQGFITRSSRRFQAYAWLQYDAQFRLKLASNPTMKWSVTDPELVATWLSADASKHKPACYACGNPEHLSSDCPWKASQTAPGLRCPVCNTSGHTAQLCPQLSHNKPSAAADSNKADDQFCQLWNRKGSCFCGDRCRYLHICSNCRGSHPKRTCSQQAR